MKGLRLTAAFLVTLLLLTMSFLPVAAQAPELKIPNPTAEFYSNDFANVIDANTESEIVSMGESTFKATDGGQVVFVSIDTLNGATIEEYANTLFNKWKIGTKDKGILFILSMKEGESRIEVGYSYEGVLTDLESYKLLNKFSEINQEKGIDEAVKTIYSDISSIVRGDGGSIQYPEAQNEWTRQQANTQNNFLSEHPILSIILIIIIVILIILDFMFTGGQVTFFILRMAAASARRGGGGGGGGHRNSGGGGRSGGGGASGRF